MFGLGYVVSVLLLYSFLVSIAYLLLLLLLVELFAIVFQTLTLANRICINIISGTLLLQLLTIAMKCNSLYDMVGMILLVGLFCFEAVNYLIQLYIYGMLSLSYQV